MNTRKPIGESQGRVALSASFNQPRNSFAVGHDSGFCIFDAQSWQIRTARDFNAGIGQVEMLGLSNLVALVGGGQQPKFPSTKVIIWEDAQKKVAISLEFRTAVKRVRLSRSRIVVTLQNSVHVYEFSNPAKLISKYETADNLYGLCELSSNTLAFTGRTPGQVQAVEINTSNVSIVPAHGTPLRALELNADGTIMATASEKGTLIRLFSLPAGTKLAEFRRGVDPATIFSLGISPDSTMLAVTSDKSTLHVFDLPQLGASKSSSTKRGSPAPTASSSSAPEEESSSHKWGFVGKIPFMPRVFSDEYSFASAPFETGDDPTPGVGSSSGNYEPIPGMPGGRPSKGIIGWLDESTILVLGTGRDGRVEKFIVGADSEGKRHCQRQEWKRYLPN